MTPIYRALFNRLGESEIFYCSWKSNHALERALTGQGDIDLYVEFLHRAKFEKLVREVGFKKFRSPVARFPYIEHYLAYEKGIIFHLHVYYKIVTGESGSKNYLLPLEVFLRRNVSTFKQINVPSHDAQIVIFLLRYFLKTGSVGGLLRVFWDREKYELEWNAIRANNIAESRDIPWIDTNEVKRMSYIYAHAGLLRRLICAQQVRHSLSRFRRLGPVVLLVVKVRNFFSWVMHRFFTKRRKDMDSGFVVSICGLDGSGKSSTVDLVFKIFSKKLTVKKIHVGRPPPTFLTFVPWILFRFAEKVRRTLLDSSSRAIESKGDGSISVVRAFRFACLGYERYVLLRRAHRWAGGGCLVICDRYVSNEYGKMDSPRIQIDENSSFIMRILHRVEQRYYSAILPCDYAFELRVPLPIALERNRRRIKSNKESDSEIRDRFRVNGNVVFKASSIRTVDATQGQAVVVEEIARDIWMQISG